jgi:streptogramin lyase
MRSRTKVGILVELVAAVALFTALLSPTEAATPLGEFTPLATAGVTSGFPAGSSPRFITTGPDGLVWFTDSESVNRINADGTVSRFDAVPTFGANPSLRSIVTGPDGNLWFTKFNPPGQIGKITPAGVMTQVSSFADGNVQDIIAGPDGNLWFTRPFATGGGFVGRITTAGVVTEFTPPNTSPQPRTMAVGPDGNIWYTDDGAFPTNVSAILRTDMNGVITQVAQAGVTAGFDAGVFADEITQGPDGNLWTSASSPGGGVILRVTPGGAVTPFTDPGLEDTLSDIVSVCGDLYVAQGIEDGVDGSVWQVTTDGDLTEFADGLGPDASPEGLAASDDDDVLVADGGDPGEILTLGTGCPEPPVTTTTTPGANSPLAASPAATAARATPSFTG